MDVIVLMKKRRKLYPKLWYKVVDKFYFKVYYKITEQIYLFLWYDGIGNEIFLWFKGGWVWQDKIT